MPDRSTIYAVAQASGVSTATVSRVMRDRNGFSEATRRRVLAAATELRWVPNAAASGLASSRAGIVGLLFPDLSQSGEAEHESPLFVDEVMRGAERAATPAGHAVLIAATRSPTGRELAFSVAGKVDGLVVLARSLSDADVAAIARTIPVVRLGNYAGRHRLDAVSVANRAGARAMTMHLIRAHGYRDLAFIGGPGRSTDSMERFAGFREACAAAGIHASDTVDAIGGFTEAGGERAMLELLARRRRPRAIVFGNDEMAVGARSVLRAAHVQVPADIAITGFDDIALSRHVRPTLSTVGQPMRELGERAVRVLFDRLEDPDAPPRHIELPTTVVIRRSCGCTARSTRPAKDDRA